MMPHQPSDALASFAASIGVLLIASAIGVLVGWWLDIALLKSLVPGLATMKANTAVCFGLFGAAILAAPRAPHLMRAAALAVGGIAAGTLFEYASAIDLGIDQWLFADLAPPGIGQGPPGRMSEMTAINFTLLATALLALPARTRGGGRPSQWLLLPVATTALLAVLGYIYGVRALYGVAGFGSVALHTALLFLCASLGVACLQPEAAPARRLTSATADGFVIRRLLPAAVLVPPVLGWLSLQGDLRGYYDIPYGVALTALANIATFAALVWWNARALEMAQQRERSASSQHAWKEAILNSAEFTVISTDVDGIIRTVNANAARQLGYAPEELVGRMTPLAFHDANEVAARAAVLTTTLGRPVLPGFEVFVARARSDGSDENDWTYIRKDGSRFPVRLSVTALRDAHGRVTGFLGIGRDISAEHAAERAQRESDARLRLVTDNLPALVAYIDQARAYRFNNATHARWLGRPLADIQGRPLASIHSAEYLQLLEPHLARALAGQTVVYELQEPESGRFVHGSFIPDRNADGSVRGVHSLVYDITPQKQAEAELWRMAQFDSLTGLANRARFRDRLREAVARSERSGVAMALAFLDLDRFKAINDCWGHPVGDAVLVEFARRVQACVRATDMVARLAGDEFVIVLESVTHPEELAHIADKLLLALRTPIDAGTVLLPVSASIGIALHQPGETDTESLQRRADAALYRAKAAGRGGYRIDAGEVQAGVSDNARAP